MIIIVISIYAGTRMHVTHKFTQMYVQLHILDTAGSLW